MLAVRKAWRCTWDDWVCMAFCVLSLKWAPDPWPGIVAANYIRKGAGLVTIGRGKFCVYR